MSQAIYNSLSKQKAPVHTALIDGLNNDDQPVATSCIDQMYDVINSDVDNIGGCIHVN